MARKNQDQTVEEAQVDETVEDNEISEDTHYPYLRNFREPGAPKDSEPTAQITAQVPYFGTEAYAALFENDDAIRAFHLSAAKKIFSNAIGTYLTENPGDFTGAQESLSTLMVMAPTRASGAGRKPRRTLTTEKIEAIQSNFNLDADAFAALAAQMGVEIRVADDS